MDATQARDHAVDDGIPVSEVTLDAHSRRTIHRSAWAVLVGVPVLSLIVGIWLTAVGTVEQLTPAGEGMFDVTWLAVWPAGLVLLAVGILGVVAAAITALVFTRDR